LAKSLGFKVIDKSTPGLLDWDFIKGCNLKENLDSGRFWKTLSKYGNQKAKNSLQSWIQEHGFSSHMRIILQK